MVDAGEVPTRGIPVALSRNIASALILIVTITQVVNFQENLDVQKALDQTLFEINSLELLMQASPRPSKIYYEFDKLDVSGNTPSYGDFEIVAIRQIPRLTKGQVVTLGEFNVNYMYSEIEYINVKTGEEEPARYIFSPIIKDAGIINYAIKNAFGSDNYLLEYLSDSSGICNPKNGFNNYEDFCNNIITRQNCTYIESEKEFPRTECEWKASSSKYDSDCDSKIAICDNKLELNSYEKLYYSKVKTQTKEELTYFSNTPLQDFFKNYVDVCNNKIQEQPLKIKLPPKHFLTMDVNNQQVCLNRRIDNSKYDPTSFECEFEFNPADASFSRKIIDAFKEDRNTLTKCCGFNQRMNAFCLTLPQTANAAKNDPCGISLETGEMIIKEFVYDNIKEVQEVRIRGEKSGDMGTYAEVCGGGVEGDYSLHKYELGDSFAVAPDKTNPQCLFIDDEERGFLVADGDYRTYAVEEQANIKDGNDLYIVPDILNCKAHSSKNQKPSAPNLEDSVELYCITFNEHNCPISQTSKEKSLEITRHADTNTYPNDYPTNAIIYAEQEVITPYQMIKLNKLADETVEIELLLSNVQRCIEYPSSYITQDMKGYFHLLNAIDVFNHQYFGSYVDSVNSYDECVTLGSDKLFLELSNAANDNYCCVSDLS